MLLEVNKLTIAFHTREGIVKAVEDASFSVAAGDILGIVGESGSGKSVSCYSLLGLIPSPPGKIESGTALFHGRDLYQMDAKSLRAIRGGKISMIFQDPMTSLNPYMRIGKQIMEAIVMHQPLDKKHARAKAIEALSEVGIRDAETRFHCYPHEFSGGMRQRVMIAMALATEPELLIADEPTTALDVTVQAQILELLTSIQAQRKLAIIFISHDLAVIKSLARHVIVMEKGKIVERGNAEDIFVNAQHPYTQKLIAAVPNSKKQNPGALSVQSPVLLDVKKLHTRFYQVAGLWRKTVTHQINAVDDISLSIRKGEILGLVGESGSGKSTLGRSIMRLVASASGQVLLEGEDLTTLTPRQLFKAHRNLQMIFQDPYASLNPRMTVFAALSEPLLTHGLADRSTIHKHVNQLLDDVGLARRDVRKYPHEFSGGQRQRIAIARAIALKPKLVIADEPVSALDVTIQAQILQLLLDLSARHELSMLFISHDLAVVRFICDRVAVMQSGKIVELGETEALFNNPRHEYTKALLAAIQEI